MESAKGGFEGATEVNQQMHLGIKGMRREAFIWRELFPIRCLKPWSRACRTGSTRSKSVVPCFSFGDGAKSLPTADMQMQSDAYVRVEYRMCWFICIVRQK